MEFDATKRTDAESACDTQQRTTRMSAERNWKPVRGEFRVATTYGNGLFNYQPDFGCSPTSRCGSAMQTPRQMAPTFADERLSMNYSSQSDCSRF